MNLKDTPMKNIFTLVLLISLTFTYSISQVVSDFEADIENWYSEGDGDYEWEIGTGNPGNNFRVNDDATGDINLSYAPSKFLGDWSSATTNDYISIDLYLNQISGGYSNSNFVFQIEGPGGRAKALEGTDPPFYLWTTYSVTFDPANWNVLEGTWAGILQQVNEIIVRMEYINGDEWNRLDNMYLSFTPVVIPVQPVICSDFEEGNYDGWSFTGTGSVSNQSSGGNPGRYIRINDATGISLATSPPKFLGDWSLLDNHAAEIHADINIISSSGGTYLHDFFIKIEGPGGEATFPIDNSIENALGQWYTFSFPIEEASWTVTSGTWTALLSNVNKLSMVLEYISGSETVGFDNFCITNLPPDADFVADKLVEFPGSSIQFNDLSIHAPTSWDWNFGDGLTSTDENPQVAYTTPGVYDVELTSTNYFGSDTENKNGYIEILDDSQCVKFADDFDDESIHPVWTLINGTWTESGDIFKQTSNYYVSGDYLGGCYGLVGSPLWEDYVINCDFKSTDDDGIGFVFNYQDNQNMYMFLWRKQTSERMVIRWINGLETILHNDAVAYAENTWYNTEISTISGEIKIKIDGMDICNLIDNTFTSGMVGAYCWANDESHYDNFKVSCKGDQLYLSAFLEGPYQGSTMTNELNTQSLLPLSQPYNIYPWNYTGNEGVLVIQGSDVCDWILVEIRDAIDASSAIPSTMVEQQAAFILQDGSIVDLDGSSPLRLSLDVQNQLFVVIYHRNHLPAMSASPLILVVDQYEYDFRTGSGQAYGTDAMKDLGNGNFGLYAGNFNGDGVIDDDDKNMAWGIEAGGSGYIQSDGNLNGQADNLDKNDFWLENQGKTSTLPE